MLPEARATRTDSDQPKSRPESVLFAFRLWLGVVALECIHQIDNITIGFLDPQQLKEQAKESATNMGGLANGDVTEAQLMFATYFSIVASGLLAILIMMLVAHGAWRFYKQQKFAENMRRMLLFFAVFLGVRGITPFFLEPQPVIPTALIVFDGGLQILIAVGAVLAALLGSKPESVQWARATLVKKDRSQLR